MSDRHCTTLYALIYLYPYHISIFSAVYFEPEAVKCKQIKILIISTFAGSWIEIQQSIICCLTQ